MQQSHAQQATITREPAQPTIERSLEVGRQAGEHSSDSSRSPSADQDRLLDTEPFPEAQHDHQQEQDFNPSIDHGFGIE
jgi:hypothetical protein